MLFVLYVITVTAKFLTICESKPIKMQAKRFCAATTLPQIFEDDDEDLDDSDYGNESDFVTEHK